MDWVLVCVSTMLAVEVFLRTGFKKNISAMLEFMKRSRATIISARISDHWKEKVLTHYALKIFINSMQLIICLLLTASPIMAVHFLGNLIGMDVLSLIMTPLGLIFSIVFVSLYIVFRVKILHVGL